MNKSSHAKTLKMVQIALLSAIVVILQLFFSAVRVGPVTLNFVLVPIVMAGVLLGPWAGLFVGAFAGMTTFIQVFTSADVFYTFLMTTNPFATACICLLKTALAGFIVGLLANGLKTFSGKSERTSYISSILYAAVCPVVNTGLFCLGMVLFFADAMLTDANFAGAMGNGVIYFIFIGLAGINFIVELVLNIILCPVLIRILKNTRYFKNAK